MRTFALSASSFAVCIPRLNTRLSSIFGVCKLFVFRIYSLGLLLFFARILGFALRYLAICIAFIAE